MADGGSAFVKGGCGCLLAFLFLGLLAVAVGGSMRIDPLGAILLFVIGGVIGLIVLAVYNKGKSDALSSRPTSAPPNPQDPALESPASCIDCGTRLLSGLKACPRCGRRYGPPPGGQPPAT